jgi:YVTN family beta-propeller protein
VNAPRHSLRFPRPPATRLFALLAPTCLLAATALLNGCRHDTFPQLPPGFQEFAYVANFAGNSVTILDVVNMREDRTVEVGTAPVAVASNATADEVYVVNSAPGQAAGSLSIIDTKHNTVVDTLRLGRAPSAIAVDPAGLRAYVANTGSNSVAVIDLKARRVLDMQAVGDTPGSLAVAPDGRSLVVANAGSGTVSIFSTPAPEGKARTMPAGPPLRLRATLTGCAGAMAAAILPDSSKAFVACSAAHAVLAINLAAAPGSWAARQDASLLTDSRIALLDVGSNPANLTVKGDSGEVFVSNRTSDSISEIAATTNDVGSTYPIGDRWIADSGGSSLSLYSIDDGKLLSSVHAGTGPVALAFADNQQLVLAVDKGSNDVALIRINSKLGPALFDMLPTGSEPVAIVMKSNQKKL